VLGMWFQQILRRRVLVFVALASGLCQGMSSRAGIDQS
jgi:hypothetical protein